MTLWRLTCHELVVYLSILFELGLIPDLSMTKCRERESKRLCRPKESPRWLGGDGGPPLKMAPERRTEAVTLRLRRGLPVIATGRIRLGRRVWEGLPATRRAGNRSSTADCIRLLI